MVKEGLSSHKYSTKFLDKLHDISNEFVRFVSETANKETMRKNKSKIVLDDIFAAFRSHKIFTEEEIEVFRKKTVEFEESETVC